MLKETYELTFRRLLDQALAAHGRDGATPEQASRCYRLGLSAGEAAALLAPFQEPSDEAVTAFGTIVVAPLLQRGA